MSTGEYTGYISVSIRDEFGLDKRDVNSRWYGKAPGFTAWWLLQHTRGYKPFETNININTSISGNIH